MTSDCYVNIDIKNEPDLPNLLANAEVTIYSENFGPIVMKDFQIWISPNLNSRLGVSINIRPPAVKYYGKWRPRIFFTDDHKWEYLERVIYESYQSQKLKQSPTGGNTNRIGNNPEVEDIKIPDDMPF